MSNVKVTTRDQNPDLASKVEGAAMVASCDAIQGLLEQLNLHPVTSVCAMIDALAHILRSMDRKAANVVIKDIAFERTKTKAQMAALQRLVEGYEGQCDQMEHEAKGGFLS